MLEKLQRNMMQYITDMIMSAGQMQTDCNVSQIPLLIIHLKLISIL